MLQLVAAALSGPLGAPNVITLNDTTSTGLRSRTAGVIVGNAGYFYSYTNNTPVVVYNWIYPLTNMSEYEVRATLSSGDPVTTGTMDTWQALSTSRSWTLSSDVEEEELSSEILLEIRWTGSGVVQDSATITLIATGPNVGEPGIGSGNNGPGGETP